MPHESGFAHPNHSPVTFHLRTLGACVLTLNDQAIKLSTRKNLAILAYLAFAPAHSESRHRLAGLLWGESPEEKARTSLRQAVSQLSELRTPAGQYLISVDRHEIRLNISALSVDVINDMAQLNHGLVPEVFLTMGNFEDAFLSVIENIDPSFAGWLHQKRAALRNEFIRKLTEILDKSNSAPEMKRVSSAILNLDSVNEPACRAFMQASCMLGDATGALRAYNELWRALQTEFDTEPELATQSLVAAIKNGESRPGKATLSGQNDGLLNLRLPFVRSTAYQLRLMVGSFTPFSENPEFNILVCALRSETLLSLTRFRELQVIDGNVGDNMGWWDFSVTCEAFLEKANVSIIFKIYRATTGLLVWSERLSLPESALLEGAACMANRIAAMVQRIIKSARIAEIDDSVVTSLDIQSRMLRAQHALMQWDKQEEHLARKLLLSIFAEDRHLASAHAGMSSSFSTTHLVFPGEFRNREFSQHVSSHALAALNIDPLDRRSHLGYAWSLIGSEDFQLAINAFHRAVNLNAADNWTYISAAEGLALCGESTASTTLLETFLTHNVPLQEQHWAYFTITRFLNEDFAGAAEASRNCPLSLNLSGAWGAASLALLGREDEARAQAREFTAKSRADWSAGTEPTDELIGQWILQGFPIALPKHKKMLVEGLSRAGFKLG